MEPASSETTLDIPLENSAETIDGVEDQPSLEQIPVLGVFEKYLSLWVALCIALGILLGYYVPAIPAALSYATVAQVSIPIAVLLWGIILPMMLQIDFQSLKDLRKEPRAILLTSVVNYVIQPFTMFGFALLFINVIFGTYLGPDLTNSYIVGLIILGGSPCTAMVFVWSMLMRGNATYTLTQVAVNDLLLLGLFAPTVKLLAGTTSVTIPWETLLLSVVFFVLIPLVLGLCIRWVIVKHRGVEFLESQVLGRMKPFSMVFLLLTLVLIFIYQAQTLIGNLVHILILALPITVQTIFVWGLTYILALWLKLPFDIAGPATLIASSNFFELAVAVTISIYGPQSPETLATVVGVLTEVPLMLTLVWINNKTQDKFPKRDKSA